MSLFRKKCEYCKEIINKGEEVFKNVKDPVFIRKRQKAFCCSEHAGGYEREIEEYMKNSKRCGIGCCGLTIKKI